MSLRLRQPQRKNEEDRSKPHSVLNQKEPGAIVLSYKTQSNFPDRHEEPFRSQLTKGIGSVLERPPQPFNEDIVLNLATAIHAYSNALSLEQTGKTTAGKLSSLVGVENL